jgi:hypothetical protein
MMMVVLFDITAGKTVIFLAIFNRENCPDVTCRKIIFFFFPLFTMKSISPRYVIHSIGRYINITHVLYVADKGIKEEVHWQKNPNSTPRYEVETL